MICPRLNSDNQSKIKSKIIKMDSLYQSDVKDNIPEYNIEGTATKSLADDHQDLIIGDPY